MIANEIVKKSFKDFLSPAILSISFLPFIISFAILLVLYLSFGNAGVEYFQNINPNEYPKLSYVLSIGFFKWLFMLFFYIIGAVFIILLSVVVATIVVGFFTPKIVKIIHKKYYNTLELPKEGVSISSSIFSFVKIFFIFLILLIISLPFLFVPVVGVIALGIPFYYLFHNFLVLDVGLNVSEKDEFKRVMKKHKTQFRSTTLSLYLVSLIPFVGVIFQVLFVVILTHLFFLKRAT